MNPNAWIKLKGGGGCPGSRGPAAVPGAFLLCRTWQPDLCLPLLMFQNMLFCKMTEKACMKYDEYLDGKNSF